MCTQGTLKRVTLLSRWDKVRRCSVIRSLRYALVTTLMVFLLGCTLSKQRPEMRSFGVTEAPLWSMPIGCEGGIRLDDGKVSVVNRDYLVDYHRWSLDISNGRVLDHSDKPVDPGRLPSDTYAEVSGNGLKPLRASSVKAITPTGFDPVVVTDKFIFAKRTWWSLGYRQITHHGQVVVVDRSSRSIVWELNGSDLTVQASPAKIVVCGYGQTAAFLPQVSRPQDITNFYSAVRHGDVQRVAELFPEWQRTPLYNLDGLDPLTSAAKEGQLEVVRQLLKLKLSPNIESADGYSPLLMALRDHREMMSLLLEAGADPNYNALYYDYPLAEASGSGGSRSIIDLLLKSGAKLNAVDHWEGRTALHAAVMSENYEAVQALLEAGADPSIRDYSGKTADKSIDPNECISHLFAGGKISEKPAVCAPPQRSSGGVTFNATGLIH